jgi:tRNA dimethylallyltransferase
MNAINAHQEPFAMLAPFTEALVLTGPTGSGKTKLGVELASRMDAEIISMDSMAIYRHMDIGTAKPTAPERQKIRHHLIDVLDPWESASVAWWLCEATACCRDIQSRGKQVLIVGGTPLYLKALICGLFDGPPSDRRLREQFQQEAEALGAEVLHERLSQLDPVTARRLHPNDVRRIIRALEVLELTGRPMSAWQTQWPKEESTTSRDSAAEEGTSAQVPQILWLDLPRQVLYDRINCRVEEMFAAGLVEEVVQLLKTGAGPGKVARQALGYKEVLGFLEGHVSMEETLERVKTRTRNFAKRQITWFRHMPHCRSATVELTERLWQPRIR